MMPTAAVGVAEYPPLSGHASGVFMRLFGAGKVASHPQNSGAHAGFRKTQQRTLQKI